MKRYKSSQEEQQEVRVICPISDNQSNNQIKKTLKSMNITYIYTELKDEAIFIINVDTNKLQKIRNLPWRSNIKIVE